MPTNPNASPLLALADRVEAASGPDRALDYEIHCRNGIEAVGMYGHQPAYTASIDAALMLVPEGHWCQTITHCPGQKAEASLIQFELRDGKYWHGKHLIDTGRLKAATPALALVSAALRAQASETGRG